MTYKSPESQGPTYRILLSERLGLREIPSLVESMNKNFDSGAGRIEIDARRLHRITEGARQMLAVAARRLQSKDVEVVVTNYYTPGPRVPVRLRGLSR